MPTNQTRRHLLERIKTSNFPGSIIDVFDAADQGIDLISQFEQQQQQEQAQQQQQEQMQQQGMQVANTPEEQEIGLREQHAMGNTGASMAFPNVKPNASFNTVGMKAPIDIKKINKQGHLVESYKNVPPGIQDLPTGPYEGTIIESPAAYKKGGVRKYQFGGVPLAKNKITGAPLDTTDYSKINEVESIGSDAMMKAAIANTLSYNPDHKAIRRMLVKPDNPYIFQKGNKYGVEEGSTGSHYMGSMGHLAMPFIQEVAIDKFGNYNALELTGPTDNPNEYIKFRGPLAEENARYFSEHYKEVSPAFQKRGGGFRKTRIFKDGGIRKKYQTAGPHEATFGSYAGVSEYSEEYAKERENYFKKLFDETGITEREYWKQAKIFQKNQNWMTENYFSKVNPYGEYNPDVTSKEIQQMHELSTNYFNSLQSHGSGYNAFTYSSDRSKTSEKIEKMNEAAGYDKYSFVEYPTNPPRGYKYQIMEIRRFEGDKMEGRDAPRMERDYDIEWAINNGYLPNLNNPNWKDDKDYVETGTTPTDYGYYNYTEGVGWLEELGNKYHPDFYNTSGSFIGGAQSIGELDYDYILNANQEFEKFTTLPSENTGEPIIKTRINEDGTEEYYLDFEGRKFTPTEKSEHRTDLYDQSGPLTSDQSTWPFTSLEGGMMPTYVPLRNYVYNPASIYSKKEHGSDDDFNIYSSPFKQEEQEPWIMPELPEILTTLLGNKGFVLGPTDPTLSGPTSTVGIYDLWGTTIPGADAMKSKVYDIDPAIINELIKQKYIIKRANTHPYKKGNTISRHAPPGTAYGNFADEYILNPDYKKGGVKKLKKRKRWL